MKKAILYVGNFFYPDGNAAGKRVYGNVKVIEKCGYVPIIFCFKKNQTTYLEKSIVDGVVTYTIPYSDGIKRLNNRKPYNAFKSVYQEYSAQYEISAVIMYTTMGTFDLNRMIISYCRRQKTKTVYDFCDYFDVIQKDNLFKYYIKSRDLKVLKQSVLEQCDGIIAISSFLRDFVYRECPKIIIPPLSVTRCEKKEIIRHPDSITISYASYVSDKNRPVAEWKDRIDLMVDIFHEIKIKYHHEDFLLKFIGFTEADLIDMLPFELKEEYRKKINELGEQIVFLGQCENKTAQNEIQNSDYTILLRDSKTSTNAGFPTKISESLSLGVPVITNLTSDIGYYVINNVNGIVVPGPASIEETIEIVDRTIKEGNKKSQKLRDETINQSPFFYMDYVERMGSFLDEIRGK
ncbi:glycosyltransferase [Sporofaciens sp. SGI.106]|uniref:glycosyltransferase n=1 Tax=Sporofaciens sp. SGI.106 TaxID=3420568 RepID=UPI003D02B2BF